IRVSNTFPTRRSSDLILGHKAKEVEKLLDDVNIVYQREQLGTGHALMQCKDVLANKSGTTVVLNGDAPLITKETLKNLIDYHNEDRKSTRLNSSHVSI